MVYVGAIMSSVRVFNTSVWRSFGTHCDQGLKLLKDLLDHVYDDLDSFETFFY